MPTVNLTYYCDPVTDDGNAGDTPKGACIHRLVLEHDSLCTNVSSPITYPQRSTGRPFSDMNEEWERDKAIAKILLECAVYSSRVHFYKRKYGTPTCKDCDGFGYVYNTAKNAAMLCPSAVGGAYSPCLETRGLLMTIGIRFQFDNKPPRWIAEEFRHWTNPELMTPES